MKHFAEIEATIRGKLWHFHPRTLDFHPTTIQVHPGAFYFHPTPIKVHPTGLIFHPIDTMYQYMQHLPSKTRLLLGKRRVFESKPTERRLGMSSARLRAGWNQPLCGCMSSRAPLGDPGNRACRDSRGMGRRVHPSPSA